VKPVRTPEEVDLFLWCMRQEGVVRRPASGGDASFNYTPMTQVWNAEVHRQWKADEATPAQLRLKTERQLRAFRDKLNAKLMAS